MRLSNTLMVRNNLTRNTLRSLLLVFCIAIAFFIFGLLSSVRQGFEGSEATAERLVVASKTGYTTTLPISYWRTLKDTDGVVDVTHITRLRAYVGSEHNIIGANAVDPESYVAVYGDTYQFTPEMVSRFEGVRNGALVGRNLADSQGWSVGDKITLTSFVHFNAENDRNWSFDVVGIFDGAEKTVDTSFLVVQQAPFNAALIRGQDRISLYGLTTEPGADIETIIRSIDGNFANSADQTRTQRETEYLSAFLRQIADINLIVGLIVGVAFATILLIVANTMIFAVRERTLEIGVLKVMGYSRTRIVFIILTETLLLFLAGLSAGLAMSAAVLPVLEPALSSVVPALVMTPANIATAFVYAALFAVITGLIPTFNALRLPIAAALRHR